MPRLTNIGPPGKREGVDVLEVHRRERVLERRIVQFARRGLDQPIAEALEIALDLRRR